MSAKQISEKTIRFSHSIKRGIIAVPVFLILLLLIAFAESNAWLPQGREVLYIFICLFAAALAAGISGTKGIRSKRICYSLFAELALLIFVLLLGLFTKESSFFNMLLFWSAITILSGAFLSAALLPGRGKKPSRRKKYNR